MYALALRAAPGLAALSHKMLDIGLLFGGFRFEFLVFARPCGEDRLPYSLVLYIYLYI